MKYFFEFSFNALETFPRLNASSRNVKMASISQLLQTKIQQEKLKKLINDPAPTNPNESAAANDNANTQQNISLQADTSETEVSNK